MSDARERTRGALPVPIPMVSVDWSKRPRGRAACAAVPDAEGWRIDRHPPPGTGWTLGDVLRLAADLGRSFEGAALIAIDAVLGLPSRFGKRTPSRGFPEALEWLERQGALAETVRRPEEWSLRRPFFAVQPGPGGMSRFIEQAGGRAMLIRAVERSLQAKPVFAASGIPGSVGSGSMALWQEILQARRDSHPAFRIWPFEIDLEEIPAAGGLALAESYPRACYAVALAPSLPGQSRPLAKRDRAVREAAIRELLSLSWIEQHGVHLAGLDSARESEDDFDALLQVAGLVRLVEAKRPLASPLVDPVWEGGILGTGGT